MCLMEQKNTSKPRVWDVIAKVLIAVVSALAGLFAGEASFLSSIF